MKANTIRSNLRGKIEPELGKVLVSFAEDIATMKQMISQLASNMNILADALDVQTKVLHQMESSVAKRARELNVSVGSDPTITGENDA